METPKEPQPARNWQQTVQYHRTLVSDQIRNEAFFKALKKVVSKNSRVLDIGSGSGIWAVAAAKLGAKRVVAVEADENLIPIIRGHVNEHGVEDRVTVVHGNSMEIDLGEKFNVIVSETVGDQGFEEGIVNVMLDAKKRYLSRGGTIVPQRVKLVAAPAYVLNQDELPIGTPFKAGYFANIARTVTYRLANRKLAKLLAPPATLLDVDLRTVKADPDYTKLLAEWKLRDISKANATIAWATTTLAPRVELDIWPTTSWAPCVYPIQPFEYRSGVLSLELNLNFKQHYWTLTAQSGKENSSHTHSPILAGAKLDFDIMRLKNEQ